MPDRLSRKVAPEEVDTEQLPNPLADGGEPLSVEAAAEAYMKIQTYETNTEQRTSRYERALVKYGRILEADRKFQEEYDLTTAMLTRNVSPFDERGEWLTPWSIDEMLNGGGIRRSIREALNYHLGEFNFEWVAVTTPRETDGTPYELTYLWIDDPDNKVTVSHLEPSLERHLDRCPGARPENHSYRVDGTDGAITVRHDPPIASQTVPAKYPAIFAKSEYPPVPATQGALHVATNLADLVVGDIHNPRREDPKATLIEGAAAGWATPRDWFRASSGVPGDD